MHYRLSTKNKYSNYFFDCLNIVFFLNLVHHGYKVGSDLTISLDFRTSQPDAVILGVSSAKVDAIGLQLVSGQVLQESPVHFYKITKKSVLLILC